MPFAGYTRPVTESVPFLTRIWLAFTCWFRLLFDARFAARVRALLAGARTARAGENEDGVATAPTVRAEPASRSEGAPGKDAESGKPGGVANPPERAAAALQLLALMQREGRLVDFLQQDLTGFSDEDVGTAARVVHDGCRRALQSRATITPCRSEAEGAQITLAPGFDARLVAISGNLAGEPPYTGVLRHGGWRIEEFKLPELVGDALPEIIQPAEVEL